MKGQRTIEPRRLKKWLIGIGLVYLLFPRDLVPDFLGRGLGYVEDLLLIGLMAYVYRRYRQRYPESEIPGSGQQRERQQAAPGAQTRAERRPSPHEILGVPPTATQDEIRAAYRARMAEYHPDKVSHLGEELQKLAHAKAVDIQQAYQELSR